jgi:hypothetical protein
MVLKTLQCWIAARRLAESILISEKLRANSPLNGRIVSFELPAMATVDVMNSAVKIKNFIEISP